MTDDRTRNEFIFRILLFIILLVTLILGVSIWLQLDQSPEAVVTMSQQETSAQQLLDDSFRGGGVLRKRPDFPVWMTFLIGSFVLLQIFCLLVAASIASRPIKSVRDKARIELLCETPMYLGLLGSLVGVCVTQFLAGTLAAPLAYVTTISGIVFYLFGRFTIALSVAGTGRID